MLDFEVHKSGISVRAILKSITAICLVALSLCLSASAQPAVMRPPVLKDVGIDQLLSHQVPLDLEFKDETGKTVKLGDYFNGKPVVLSLVYYDCPQLCNLTLNGLMNVLKTLPMKPGKEFVSLTVSFDPKEKPELAAEKRNTYLQKLANPEINDGWHFLTGEEAAIQALTKSVGFRFIWDPVSKQYAHSSALIVITPEGKVSRYFYPSDVLANFQPRDIRFGLLDASGGKIGSLADQVILYCYQYDPERGVYGLVIMRIMRIFAIITILTLVALILFLRHKTKQKEAAWAAQGIKV
jgi:protein SCO1/2